MSFQSLYVGSTGLISHGTRMQAVGNNLANVNTVGYKSANVHFASMMSESVTAGNSSSTGISQAGLGVRVGGILTDFSSATPMAGSATTDLAISGKGFFRVVNPNESQLTYYTRAGNFRFDKDGYLVDPSGYRLQAQSMAGGTAGATGDLHLDQDEEGTFTIDPIATTAVKYVANLGGDEDNSSDGANPFFAMLSNWDATKDDPLPDALSAMSTSMTIYDANGEAQQLTLSFDKVGLSNADGNSYYEFLVTMDPSKDGSALAGTSGAGLLMAGVMTFGSTNQLKDISTFTYSGSGDVKQLSNWAPSALGASGYPEVAPTFAASGSNAASTTSVTLNFGIGGTGWKSGMASNASVLGGNGKDLGGLAGIDLEPLAMTSYSGSTATTFQSQDGSARGYLQNLSVTSDGVLVGNYSNGLHKDLYQLTLYNFTSEFGLRREGGNHFSETLASGEAVEGTPDSGNFGVVSENSLETSNVDMADQFAKMIITERGFQANSKVVTTSDRILEILTGMKR